MLPILVALLQILAMSNCFPTPHHGPTMSTNSKSSPVTLTQNTTVATGMVTISPFSNFQNHNNNNNYRPSKFLQLFPASVKAQLEASLEKIRKQNNSNNETNFGTQKKSDQLHTSIKSESFRGKLFQTVAHKVNKMDFDGNGEFFDISNFNENEESQPGPQSYVSIDGGSVGSESEDYDSVYGPEGRRKTVYEYVPGVPYSHQYRSFLEEMQESKEKKTNLINDGADDSWVPAVSAVVIVLIVFSISVFACCIHCPFCIVYRMTDPQRII